MSQDTAAHACGIDRRYYARLEKGEKNPTLKVVEKIAKGLAVPPSDLLARAERLRDSC